MRFLRSIPMAVALAAAVFVPTAQADIVADSADDVCAALADPCVVAERVEVVDQATLDFGTRALSVTGSGQLDFGNRRGTVLAGPIALGGNGVLAHKDGEGDRATISARRRCSNNNAICLNGSECGAGGTCSVGPGTLTLTGNVDGKTGLPGIVILQGAGDVLITGAIDLSGNTAESDGGILSLRSNFGSVTVNGPIKVDSGLGAFGGELSIHAGVDVGIHTPVTATGGDFDGGEIGIQAGRDILIDVDINVDAIGGSGGGGAIDQTAGRDIILSGGSGADRVVLSGDGHEDSENFSGDGGDHTFFADRDIVVGQFVSIVARGSTPDGYGGNVTLDAGGDVQLAGGLEATAAGVQGDGGFIDVTAVGTLVTDSTSLLSADGGSVGAVSLRADGDVHLGGNISLIGRQTGFGGFLTVSSDADLFVTGTMTANRILANIDLEACRIRFHAGANYNNNSRDGTTTLIAHESMRFDAGSFLLGRTGAEPVVNTLIYRTAAKPPVTNGTITPAPVKTVDGDLPGCPVCGNAELDETETCDDGNTVGGDACGALCQLQGCVDETQGGFPANPLCNDGSECTVDTCNVAEASCDHVVDCNDDVACTTDSCQGTVCQNAPNDAACSDGNFCDGTETCNAETGCVDGTVPNCDDQIPCTMDGCSNGLAACTHTANHGSCADGVFCNGDELCSTVSGCLPAQPAVRNCADAFACTTDTCNEAGDVCDHAPNHAACEDEDVCTINTCVAGEGCHEEPSGLPECPVTTTTTLPDFLCGDATGNGILQASDSLGALRAAVGTGQCEVLVCDVNSSGAITASDALAILKKAVGQDIELNCGSAAGLVPDDTSTTTTTTIP